MNHTLWEKKGGSYPKAGFVGALALLTTACAHGPAMRPESGPQDADQQDTASSAPSKSSAMLTEEQAPAPAPAQDSVQQSAAAPGPDSEQQASVGSPADTGRSPASNPADFAIFNGSFQLVGPSGAQASCDSSLSVSVEFDPQQGVSRVQLTQDYTLDVGSGAPQPSDWGSNESCQYFTDDELTDNYDTLTEKGQQIQPTDPQWEIERSYSKRCGRSTIPTFSGFDTWYFTPHGETGEPEISRHTIFGREYQCLYRKS